MKKLITLLFAVALVTAASAQSGDRYRNNNSGYNNSYQTTRYSNQYSRSSQWNDRRDHNRYQRNRWAERQRYEMMMRRNRARYYSHSRYDRYTPYGYSRKPVLQLSIGIGGRR